MTRASLLVAWILPLVVACGGGDDGGDDGAGGSSAGSPGAGGSSSGGTSSGGGGSSAMAVEVYDPALTKPSYDCRSDANGECISVSGTVNGATLDWHAATAPPVPVLFYSPNRWPIAVSAMENDTTVGYYAQIDIPEGPPGTFHHTMAAGVYDGADVMIANDDAGGSVQGDHFLSGEIAGVIAIDAATGNTILTGTFRGKWSAPADDDCFAGVPSTCAPAEVHGSFRGIHTLDF
jgi:hypothetical protein